MSLYPRGTEVEFVGKPPGRPDQESSAKHYVDKYGVQVGDYGTVVRVKNGWWRVSFTRQDGSRAVAVPMRLNDIKKRKYNDDVEDELVNRLKRLTTGDSETLTKLDVVTDDREVLDKIIEEERAARDQKHQTTEDTTAEPVEPPMNENFGLRNRSADKRKRSLVEMLDDMHNNWTAKEAKLKAELKEVKLQLISARALIQQKDKTIAKLRGEPTFESWGDWVVA